MKLEIKDGEYIYINPVYAVSVKERFPNECIVSMINGDTIIVQRKAEEVWGEIDEEIML